MGPSLKRRGFRLISRFSRSFLSWGSSALHSRMIRLDATPGLSCPTVKKTPCRVLVSLEVVFQLLHIATPRQILFRNGDVLHLRRYQHRQPWLDMKTHKPLTLNLPVIIITTNTRWNSDVSLGSVFHSSSRRHLPGNIFVLLATKAAHQSFQSHRHPINSSTTGNRRRFFKTGALSQLISFGPQQCSTGSQPVGGAFTKEDTNRSLPTAFAARAPSSPNHHQGPGLEDLWRSAACVC